MKLKKTAVILIILMFSISFSGCSKSNSSKNNNSKKQKANQQTAVSQKAVDTDLKVNKLKTITSESSKTEISAFCGSASKPAMEECARIFKRETGIKVLLHFSGSGTMLSQMKMSRRGDIYIPGTPDYMIKAEKEDIVRKDTIKIIAYLVPSILVRKGNPKSIHGLEDLSKPGIRVAIGNPDSVCVGLYAVEILSRAELLKKVSRNIVTLGGSCSKTAALIPMQAVDAIIGWRVFSKWNPETTEAVFINPEFIPRIAYIPAAVSTFTQKSGEAKIFINFLTGKKGQKIFAKWGYLPTEKQARYFAPDAKIGGEYILPSNFIFPGGNG